MFHTHFYGVETLSEGDRRYIKDIMHAIPSWKQKLYFPIIVLPERKIKSYVCVRYNSEVCIKKDEVNIL